MFPETASSMSSAVGLVVRSSSAFTEIMYPGVQSPHCTAPVSMKACCTGCSLSPSATPSMVVISAPLASAARVTHELMGLPLSMIEQAPHSPVLQQSFVPLNSNVSRRKSNSDVDGSALALTDLPLIVVLMVRLIMLPPCRWRLSRFVSSRGGGENLRSRGDV